MRRLCGWPAVHVLSLLVVIAPLGQVTGQCEVDKLTASDAAGADKFGASVSISGDVAVIGALYDDHGGHVDAGSAYVFGFDSARVVKTVDADYFITRAGVIVKNKNWSNPD